MFRLTVIASFLCIASLFSTLATSTLIGENTIIDGDDEYDDRIVGGNSSFIESTPYIASLQRRRIHFCAGSIISRTIILTAGHCILGVMKEELNKLTARVGATMWSTGGQVRNIIGMKAHKDYKPATKNADIGLIQVSPPITLSKTGSPKAIQLADGVPADGKTGIICGWGVTKEKGSMPTMLQKAEVISISKDKCSQPPWNYGSKILPGMICAQANGKDACQGDSGGPYVSKKSGKLWGVISWGHGCGREGYPGVMIAVVAYTKWIVKNSENF